MLTPGRYYPGSTIRMTASFADQDGAAADPDTLVVKLMDPAGVTTSYTYGTDTEVGRSAAGSYYADVTPDVGGRWHLRWIATTDDVPFITEQQILIKLSPFVDGLEPPAYRR